MTRTLMTPEYIATLKGIYNMIEERISAATKTLNELIIWDPYGEGGNGRDQGVIEL